MDDPLPRGEFVCAEEPRTAVFHRHQRNTVDRRLEAEPEEVCLPLSEELIDVNVVMDHVAGPRKLAVENHRGVEEAVDGLPFGDEVDAEVA